MATADATLPTGNGKVLPVGSDGAMKESPSHTRQSKAPAGQTLDWGGPTQPIEVHYGTPRARTLRHKELFLPCHDFDAATRCTKGKSRGDMGIATSCPMQQQGITANPHLIKGSRSPPQIFQS